MDKKAILWPVIVSLVLHLLLLGVTGMIRLHDKIVTVDILSVSLQAPDRQEKRKLPKAVRTSKKKINVAEASRGTKKDAVREDWREDTVELNSSDVKYVAYLSGLKTRILRHWKYPREAFEKGEEGEVMLKMSIDAEGNLLDVKLLLSSGSVYLDGEAIDAVQAAAPYDPLPQAYHLSCLHVIASFNYKMVD